MHGFACTAAVLAVSEILEEPVAYCYQGRFHLPLGEDGWTIAISADSAGRIRLDACRGGQVRDTLWILAGDRERLAELVRELSGLTALPV